MPKTPQLNFSFTNENVQASTPLLGVSHVLARTTRGKFNSPDELIYTWAQFQRIYGNEIVPDGTISNIKKALELGSILRVSRVAGKDTPSYGYARTTGSDKADDVADATKIEVTLQNPADDTEKYVATMVIRTKEQGSSVLDSTGINLDRDFYLKLSLADGPTTKISLIQSKTSDFDTNNILDSMMMFSGSDSFIEPNTLRTFLNESKNVTLELVSIKKGTTEDPTYDNSGMDGVVALFSDYYNWKPSFKIGETTIGENNTSVDLVINEGNTGGDSNEASWKKAYDAIAGYTDSYQVICSHLHQHLNVSTEEIAVYKYIADNQNKFFNSTLFVEVPKLDDEGEIRDIEGCKTWLKSAISTVGASKNVAYFGGGIRYYNDRGSLQICDVLGTVIGLADRAASNNGPWYSFAGMNRGLVPNSKGPGFENLGGSTKIPELQELADWYMNLFLIKDTPTLGKQTMLWHNFTSNPRNDSEKFLGIVRLNLYLKKNLTPILESYLEEPNIWDTWKLIYYRVKDILDDLVTRNAMSEYTWMGDQFATSYSDLSVNNEADVRQGKYRAKLKYKDIVAMQEIYIDVTIDSVSKDVSLTVTE